MRQQILVQIGQLAGILGGDQRLAIGADGGGKIRRDHRGQRLAFLHLVARAPPEAATPGREKGASTAVAWSLSKSTMPVVSTFLR